MSPYEGMSMEVECASRLHAMPEYAALEDELRAAGFEPTYRPPIETRSAEAVLVIVAIYVLDKLADDAIDQLFDVVRHWARTRLRPLLRGRGIPQESIPIYGPDGEVIREVPLLTDEDSG